MQRVSLIFSYRTLRKMVGYISFAIPFACIVAMFIAQQKLFIPSSISVTYHLGARDVFVGMLAIVGAFLLAYNGHRPPKHDTYLCFDWQRMLFKLGFYKVNWEFWLSKLAGLCAWSVALFPTSFMRNWLNKEELSLMDFPGLTLADLERLQFIEKNCSDCNPSLYDWVPFAHICAAIFLIFVLFLLCLNYAMRTRRKLNVAVWPNGFSQEDVGASKIASRYSRYKMSAIAMATSAIVGGILLKFGPYQEIAMMLLEVGCLWAFALCWFTAGAKRYREEEHIEDFINAKLDELV